MIKRINDNGVSMLSSCWIWAVQFTLILLKLTGEIEWSWRGVLVPLIIWACMVGGAIAIVFIAAAHDEYVWRKRSKR